MLVSIITVCYNSVKTIGQTMESVKNQTYRDFEYLIIDGGSTDGTVDLIKRYEPLFEGRLKWISESDNGIYDAMNKGIAMASGELIGIINSDDYYECDAVEIMVRHLPQNSYAVLYGEMRYLVGDVEDSVTIVSPHFLDRRSMNHPSCFITKKTYEKYGLYDTQYCCVADYDLFLRYRQQEEIVFVPVYEIIANMRTGGASSTQKAYFDLLKLQVHYGMMTKREAWTLRTKAKLSSLRRNGKMDNKQNKEN